MKNGWTLAGGVAFVLTALSGAPVCGAEAGVRPNSAAADFAAPPPSAFDNLGLKGADDPTSATEVLPAVQSSLEANGVSTAIASKIGLQEPPTWSLTLFGLLSLVFIAYRRSRSRFRPLSPTQDFDRRRFRGRLQTAFAWTDHDGGHAPERH